MNFKELEKRAKENEIELEITNNIYATYYVMSDGTQLNFGYDNLSGYRDNDHRVLFALFDEIERNDWKSILNTTKLLGYSPETNDCWCLPNQELSKEQIEFIKRNNCELIAA